MCLLRAAPRLLLLWAAFPPRSGLVLFLVVLVVLLPLLPLYFALLGILLRPLRRFVLIGANFSYGSGLRPALLYMRFLRSVFFLCSLFRCQGSIRPPVRLPHQAWLSCFPALDPAGYFHIALSPPT